MHRETDDGVVVAAEPPAVVSVGEKINEPRYPSFKGIMAAKKKPVTTLTAGRPGHRRRRGRLGRATTSVVARPNPPKSAGGKVDDEGDGGAKIAAFLVAQKLI